MFYETHLIMLTVQRRFPLRRVQKGKIKKNIWWRLSSSNTTMSKTTTNTDNTDYQYKYNHKFCFQKYAHPVCTYHSENRGSHV